MVTNTNKKNSTSTKISILAQAFLDREKLTTNEIGELLNTNSRTTVNTHIKSLKNYGVDIVSKKINTKSYYVLNTNDLSSINNLLYLSYQPITEDILRKYSIIQELQEGPVPRKEFKNHFVLLNQVNDLTDFENLIPLDIRQTYFYRLLNEQLVGEEREIYLDTNDDNYYLTGNNIPLLISLDDNNFLDICDQLTSLSPGSPYYEQLQSVSHKLTLMNSAADKSDITDESYLIYGKHSSEYSKIKTNLTKLKKYDFKNKVLDIEYKTRNGYIETYSIATGFIVYSIEKDCLYLIGNNINELTPNLISPIILVIKNIISIKESTLINTFYNCPLFEEMYDEMFCVSTENPIDIIIEFDNIYQIPRRLEYLNTQRNKHRELSKRKLDKERNVWIYTDRIRGKSDLKEYLRQFGSSARVISPLWLCEEMKESAKRALNRYNEETEHE